MALRPQHAAAPGNAPERHDDARANPRGEEAGERDGGRAAPRRRRPRSRWLLIGAASILALALAVVYGPRVLYLWRHESTDDAYVVGNTIVAIVPQVSGRVVSLRVDTNQQVASGDLLLQIDPSEYRVAVDRAAANVSRWEASLANARQELERARPLARRGVTSAERLDSLRAAEREARAQLALARAELEAAQIDLARTSISAPVSGRVTERNVSAGDVVQPGDRLFALVDLDDVRVEANFKETQIAQMRRGQPVDLEVDAYPDTVFHGRIESFQAGTGSVFSLLPPENATGQFVKIVQRLPIRIAVDREVDRPVLYPGLSVVAHVDTRAPGSPDVASPAAGAEATSSRSAP